MTFLEKSDFFAFVFGGFIVIGLSAYAYFVNDVLILSFIALSIGVAFEFLGYREYKKLKKENKI